MGLRDRLKGAVKRVIGGGDAPKAGAGQTTGVGKDTPDGWRVVAPVGAIKEGAAGTYGHNNSRVVAIFLKDGTYYAVDNECRHEDGPVGEGAIKGCLVKCPYHEWEYDFTTGKCTTQPDSRLETYGVRVQDGFIQVGPVLTPGTTMRGGEHNDGLKVITR
ncbi:MAG: hypothetical protein EXR69_12380 [Myxococcales bacterium]|nr:hypothetical protein [Myxococcales bacterium]